MSITLAYWGFSGLAQPSRYVLAYSGVQWQDKIYHNKDQWFSQDKQTLGFKFPNLPYLVDGDNKITQSAAILRYLPKRVGKPELLGKNMIDQAQVDIFLGVFTDLVSTFVAFRNSNPNWLQKKTQLYEKLQSKLDLLQKNSAEDYAIGYPTIVDFRLADFVTLFELLLPQQIKSYAKLVRIRDNVYNLPGIKAYRQKGVTQLFPPQPPKTE